MEIYAQWVLLIVRHMWRHNTSVVVEMEDGIGSCNFIDSNSYLEVLVERHPAPEGCGLVGLWLCSC